MRLLDADEPFALVISDLGLPQRDGAQFLTQLRARWPQVMRMVMTSAADANTTTGAADGDLIDGIIAKPWNDQDPLRQVRQTLERRAQEQQKLQRAQRSRTRTEELQALNASLEQDISASRDELALANRRLKSNFIVTLKVFAGLIETRRKHMMGHARRVADLARKLALRLKLEPALVQEVVVAGLLHDIGKLAFPDALRETPVASMTPRQLDVYRQHPARAEQLLMPLQDLRGAAASIAAQLERFDGTGFPRQLQGRAILVGARILIVCADCDNLQIGMLAPRWLTPRQALAMIERSSGKRYDPWVAEAFSAQMRGKPDAAEAQDPQQAQASEPDAMAEALKDLLVAVSDLDPGAILSRDLITPAGLMMLPAGHTINDRLIQKMVDFERTDGVKLAVYIRKPTDSGSGTDTGTDTE